MKDLSYMDPPIEIAAGSPRLEMILQRLRSNGMRPYEAHLPLEFQNPDPLLIDLQSVSMDVVRLCARAQMMEINQKLIVLDGPGIAFSLTDAVVVPGDDGLSLLPARLRSAARRDARDTEVSARRRTAALLGAKLPFADPSAAPHLLYLGRGSPLFLNLQGALRERGVRVTAALSQLTAEEYLSSADFTAILVDVAAGADIIPTALEQKNLLNRKPVFALLENAKDTAARSTDILGIAAELVVVSNRALNVADQLERLSRKYLASIPPLPKRSLSSRIADPNTGLFSKTFIKAHLQNQMEISDERADPLSLLTLKVTSPSGAVSPGIMRDFATALTPLQRQTDCAAALGSGVIAITLPTTPYRGGVLLGERIASAGSIRKALRGMSLSWRVVERRAYHTPQTLLGAGLIGPYSKVVAA